jgi:predicted dinucleotide-binding enzyme
VSASPSHRGDSEVTADLVAPTRVAKAASTLVAAVLGSDPHHAGGQWVILRSGGEAEAEAEVVALFGAALARERWSAISSVRRSMISPTR